MSNTQRTFWAPDSRWEAPRRLPARLCAILEPVLVAYAEKHAMSPAKVDAFERLTKHMEDALKAASREADMPGKIEVEVDGSAFKGTATEDSDVDLVVRTDDDITKRQRKYMLDHLWEHLRAEYGEDNVPEYKNTRKVATFTVHAPAGSDASGTGMAAARATDTRGGGNTFKLEVDVLFENATVGELLSPRLNNLEEYPEARKAVVLLKLFQRQAGSVSKQKSYALEALIIHLLDECGLDANAGGPAAGFEGRADTSCDPPDPPSVAQAFYMALGVFLLPKMSAKELQYRVSRHVHFDCGYLFDRGRHTNWRLTAERMLRDLCIFARALDHGRYRATHDGSVVDMGKALEMLETVFYNGSRGGSGNDGGREAASTDAGAPESAEGAPSSQAAATAGGTSPGASQSPSAAAARRSRAGMSRRDPIDPLEAAKACRDFEAWERRLRGKVVRKAAPRQAHQPKGPPPAQRPPTPPAQRAVPGGGSTAAKRPPQRTAPPHASWASPQGPQSDGQERSRPTAAASSQHSALPPWTGDRDPDDALCVAGGSPAAVPSPSPGEGPVGEGPSLRLDQQAESVVGDTGQESSVAPSDGVPGAARQELATTPAPGAPDAAPRSATPHGPRPHDPRVSPHPGSSGSGLSGAEAPGGVVSDGHSPDVCGPQAAAEGHGKVHPGGARVDGPCGATARATAADGARAGPGECSVARHADASSDTGAGSDHGTAAAPGPACKVHMRERADTDTAGDGGGERPQPASAASTPPTQPQRERVGGGAGADAALDGQEQPQAQQEGGEQEEQPRGAAPSGEREQGGSQVGGPFVDAPPSGQHVGGTAASSSAPGAAPAPAPGPGAGSMPHAAQAALLPGPEEQPVAAAPLQHAPAPLLAGRILLPGTPVRSGVGLWVAAVGATSSRPAVAPDAAGAALLSTPPPSTGLWGLFALTAGGATSYGSPSPGGSAIGPGSGGTAASGGISPGAGGAATSPSPSPPGLAAARAGLPPRLGVAPLGALSWGVTSPPSPAGSTWAQGGLGTSPPPAAVASSGASASPAPGASASPALPAQGPAEGSPPQQQQPAPLAAPPRPHPQRGPHAARDAQADVADDGGDPHGRWAAQLRRAAAQMEEERRRRLAARRGAAPAPW